MDENNKEKKQHLHFADLQNRCPGYDNKDCPGQVTYSVGQEKISVACPTGQVVISFLSIFY